MTLPLPSNRNGERKAAADLERMRREYAVREARSDLAVRYSPLALGNLFITQMRQRATVRLLRRNGVSSLSGLRVLEVGCGGGGILLEYLSYGVPAANLVGVDLLRDRLHGAKDKLPGLQLVCADGQALPFLEESFDLVLIYTAFSSVLDSGLRFSLADEVKRILKKKGGTVAWYDFWVNPRNTAVRGVPMRELRRLFPGFAIDSQRITLAPPVSRVLAPISWLLATILESLRIFNTHYMVVMRPPADGVDFEPHSV